VSIHRKIRGRVRRGGAIWVKTMVPGKNAAFDLGRDGLRGNKDFFIYLANWAYR